MECSKPKQHNKYIMKSGSSIMHLFDALWTSYSQQHKIKMMTFDDHKIKMMTFDGTILYKDLKLSTWSITSEHFKVKYLCMIECAAQFSLLIANCKGLWWEKSAETIYKVFSKFKFGVVFVPLFTQNKKKKAFINLNSLIEAKREKALQITNEN